MNQVTYDHKVVINTQGIRFVTWGESESFSRGKDPWYVSVTYKGNHQTFYYKTEMEARELFAKIRHTMTKIREEKQDANNEPTR